MHIKYTVPTALGLFFLISANSNAADLSKYDPGPAIRKVARQGQEAASHGVDVIKETAEEGGKIIQEIKMPDPKNNQQQITCRRTCVKKGDEIVCGDPAC